MTKIRFYKGLRTIGGTLVEVETEQARCLFDFGFEVNERCDDKIAARKDKIVADYVRLSMIPAVDGIFEEEDVTDLTLKPFEEDGKSTFFVISHMHIDHMGGLGMLAEGVPVYMSEDSLVLYRMLAANGDITYKEHKNCKGIPYGEEFVVGDIKVKVLPIDHDVIGASGFLITTEDGTIAYTGDYRYHGFHKERTEAFSEAVKNVDMLITEGVTVSFGDVDMLTVEEDKEQRTEYTLLEEMKQLSKERDGLLVVNPYNRNVERVHALYQVMKECGRTLVLDPVQAEYVSGFYPEEAYAVYEPVLKAVEESRQASDSKHKELPENWSVIARDELLQNPGKYALQLDYHNMYELFDLSDVTSAYVHMDGAPLGDYDPSFNKMKALLQSMNIPYEFRSLGGHAKPYFLKKMVDTIEPKVLVPLHSFRPEQVNSEKAGKRVLPEYGQTYELKEHDLVLL